MVAKSARSKTSTKKHSPARHGASTIRVKNRPLRDHTEEALQKYFGDLNGHRPGDLYELVLGEVEEPLFKTPRLHKGTKRARRILGTTAPRCAKSPALQLLVRSEPPRKPFAD